MMAIFKRIIGTGNYAKGQEKNLSSVARDYEYLDKPRIQRMPQRYIYILFPSK